MKIRKIVVLGLLFSCVLSGCKKENVNLVAGELKTNTFMIDKDGAVQVALVEPLDKAYYNGTELEEFLNGIVSDYNGTAGEGAVTMESFLVNDNVASAVFKYSNIEHYKNLTEEDGNYSTMAEVSSVLPNTFLDVNGKETALNEIQSQKDQTKYKVLVVKEEYDVMIPGTIQYYTNASLLSNNSVHTTGQENTFIIYK